MPQADDQETAMSLHIAFSSESILLHEEFSCHLESDLGEINLSTQLPLVDNHCFGALAN